MDTAEESRGNVPVVIGAVNRVLVSRAGRRGPAAVVVGQELGAHHRHERARQQERAEHGEGDGDGQRTEQEAAHAAHQGHGRQHDVGGEGGHQHGDHHLGATIEGRPHTRFAQAVIAVVVFQLDDGVVHKRPDGQGQAAERHGVDGVARHIQADDGAEQRQRNRHAGDERHAPVAQEDEDHDRHQHGADKPFVKQRVDGLGDVDRLIHDEFELGPRRTVLLHVLHVVLHALGDIQRAGPLLAKDGHIDFFAAVDAADARGLNGGGVLDLADVLEQDVIFRVGRDGQVVQLLDLVRHHVGVEQELIVAEIGDAGRHHHVAVLERLDDIAGRQVPRLHLLRIEVDQNGAVLAADGDGSDAALDGAEHVAHPDAADVLDVGLIHGGIADGEDAQRQRAGGVEGQHDGRQRIGRQRGQRAERELAGHGQGAVGVHVVAEIDAHDADARHRLGNHRFRTGRLVAPAFDAIGDGLFDGGSGHALVISDDLHGGGLEDRQNVHGDAPQRDDAEEQDHEDDGGHHVRITQRRLNQPHPKVLSERTRGRIVEMSLNHSRSES